MASTLNEDPADAFAMLTLNPSMRRPPTTSPVAEEAASRGPIPTPRPEGGRPKHQVSVQQFLDEEPPAAPEETPSAPRETTRKVSLGDKIQRAWFQLKNPHTDPEFSHLPKGLRKRIDPNKDPLKDKLLRLGRREKKKKLVAPSQEYSPIPELTGPLRLSAGDIESLPLPRRAPAIRSHMSFDDPGPAFDGDNNPLGGEHSVLHEEAEGREQRNRATQEQRMHRAESDRFLAQRRQRHIRNSLIGRAPPLSRRYILEKMNRMAERGKPKPQVQAPTPTPTPAPAQADKRDLGLPADGARPFRWDRAILPKKSTPSFSIKMDDKDTSAHSAIASSDNTLVRGDDLEHIAATASTGQPRGLATINHGCSIGRSLSDSESSATHVDESNDDSSDYDKGLDSDDDSQDIKLNILGQTAEQHAEGYLKELAIPDEGELESSSLTIPAVEFGNEHISSSISSRLHPLDSEKIAESERSLLQSPVPRPVPLRVIKSKRRPAPLRGIESKGRQYDGDIALTHGGHNLIHNTGATKGESMGLVTHSAGQEHARHKKSDNAAGDPDVPAPLNYQRLESTTRFGHQSQGMQGPPDVAQAPRKHRPKDLPSRIPRMRQLRQPSSRGQMSQIEHPSSGTQQDSLCEQNLHREAVTYSSRNNTEDDSVPRIRERSQPGMEKLSQPSKRQATTAHSGNSQGTQEPGSSCPLGENMPRYFSGCALKLPVRYGAIDSVIHGSRKSLDKQHTAPAEDQKLS